MDVVYVTSNEEKAENFRRYMGMDISHESVDVYEIQTLDSHVLVEHKARAAYEQLRKPVLVEDVSLALEALDGLPGPFVKYFVSTGETEPLRVERLCRMLDGFSSRVAVACCTFALYDGKSITFFDGSLRGVISDESRGTGGFGFDRVFMPEGFDGLTAAELDTSKYEEYYTAIKPFEQIRNFLDDRRHDTKK